MTVRHRYMLSVLMGLECTGKGQETLSTPRSSPKEKRDLFRFIDTHEFNWYIHIHTYTNIYIHIECVILPRFSSTTSFIAKHFDLSRKKIRRSVLHSWSNVTDLFPRKDDTSRVKEALPNPAQHTSIKRVRSVSSSFVFPKIWKAIIHVYVYVYILYTKEKIEASWCVFQFLISPTFFSTVKLIRKYAKI